jgi:hypothetical protein
MNSLTLIGGGFSEIFQEIIKLGKFWLMITIVVGKKINLNLLLVQS